jgi:hypothetical protein
LAEIRKSKDSLREGRVRLAIGNAHALTREVNQIVTPIPIDVGQNGGDICTWLIFFRGEPRISEAGGKQHTIIADTDHVGPSVAVHVTDVALKNSLAPPARSNAEVPKCQ